MGEYAIRKFGHIAVDQLTSETIEKGLRELLAHGGRKDNVFQDGRPLAAKTVREVAFLMKRCLAKLAAQRRITNEPDGIPRRR